MSNFLEQRGCSMSKFRVGDQVEAVRDIDGKISAGQRGVVVRVEDDNDNDCWIMVAWEGLINGHSGPFKNERKDCWGVDAPELRRRLVFAPPTAHREQSYHGNGKHSWEYVAPSTMRLRVPGGWLYKREGDAYSFAMAFVPMPEVVKHKV